MITTAMIVLGSWIFLETINLTGPVDLPPGCTTEELSHLVRLGVSDKAIEQTCNPIIKIKRERIKK